MARVAELLAAAEQLPGPEARREAEVLLCAALARPRSYLFAWPEAEVGEDAALRFHTLLQARARGEPVAYLLGVREFWGMTLRVSEATLIPRADSECLVETALALPLDSDEALRALDLGTGSGAIALALARERPAWRITGVDVNAAAVEVAAANARDHGLHDLVFRTGDWFEPVTGERFDLIVANPPYLAPDDPHLGRGDLRHEPRQALVADAGGYADLEQIIDAAPAHLAPGGLLALEHGLDQGPRVRRAFTARGFTAVETRRDLAGHERVTRGAWTGASC